VNNFIVMGYFNNGMKVLAVVESFEDAHNKRVEFLKTGTYSEVVVGGMNAYFGFPAAK